MSLSTLLQQGLVAPGAVLEATVGGRVERATLRSDGWVLYANVAYRSLSAAGGAVKEAVAGRDLSVSERSTDGWAFWHARDHDGNSVALKELRRRAVL